MALPFHSDKTVVIEPTKGWMALPGAEVWSYRDLLWEFVKRDFTTRYRQTLLGPIWYVLQPLITTAVLTVVFGRIAHLSTEQAPAPIFYLSGLLAWSYFAQTMPAIAATFTANSQLFGKVYFPRLTLPLSQLAGNLVALALQFVAFAALMTYYRHFTDFGGRPMTPLLPASGLVLLSQLQIMALALGTGSLLAAATGKYRDLQHVLPVFVQLWFYATPIVYPLSMISREARWHWVATLNPMSAPAEGLKLALLGESSWTPALALGGWATTIVLLFVGLAAFSRAERTVIDVA
jgi:lipopolysaccharide transport system permease protein